MNIPQLRFSGFDGEWEKKSFYECVEIKGKLVNPRNEQYQELPHIGPGNIEKFTGRILKCELVKNEELISGKFEFDNKDVVYSKIRPELNKVVFPEFKGLCSADAYPLRASEGVMEPYFLFQQLMSPKFIKYSISVSMRTGMPKINREELAGFVFHLPKLTEQKKVSKFFRLLNLRIQKQQEKIEKLEQFKKGMMQKIFSQELRFKDEDGGEFQEWEDKELNAISVPIKRTLREIDHQMPVLTISAGKGFLNQTDRFSQVIAGESLGKYTLLRKGELAYNRGASKAFPFGCVYSLQTYEEALVPNVYRSFQLIEGYETSFYEQLFSTGFADRQLRQFVSSSARIDGLLNINQDDFFTLMIPVPPTKEQEIIGNYLNKLDRKIEKEKEKLMVLEEQKKGFMQGMFV